MRSALLSLIILLSCVISANGNNNDCGRIKIKSSNQLSFNGTAAIPGLFPWLAPLFHSQKGYVCGSSIITKNHLLTAAHCVISKANDYHALFGRFDLSNDNEVNWTNRNMSKVYVHDEFNIAAKKSRSNADIAIFTFTLELQYNDLIQPICLPDQSASTININGIVAGFKKTNINGNYQNIPTYVLLQSIDNWSCTSRDNRYGNIVSHRSFCATSQTSIPCQGDSGDGYYALGQDSRGLTIYGILSFAIGLCHPKDYVAFVDVPKFIPWINEKINENIGSTSDPCESTDCGMHSECKIINERASCQCMSGFLGTPPYCDFACSTNSECSTYRSCFRGICTDLCLELKICVKNAECSMQDHKPECKCMKGFIGNGYSSCVKDKVPHTLQITANKNECGRIKIKSSIQLSFNGTAAIPGLFPWLAPLFHSKEGYICGSSVITKNHILTAAHCVISNAKDYHALFGRFDLSNDNEVNWTNRNMSKVYIHDEFNISATSLRSNADIAIFAFLLELQYNDFVQPICLPDQSDNTINIFGIVTGHGKTNIYADYQKMPSYVLLRSTDNWSCLSKDIRYGNIVSGRSFCAGSQTSIPCQGDSGGAFCSLDQHTRRHTVYGIVSFAIGLCDPKDYVAFVDVPKFIPWINEKIDENIGSTSDPCELLDCGMHSECRVINERASCRCMPGFLGTPPYCDVACSADSDCSTIRSCFRGICTNLCLGSRICVENAECSMKDHRPDCKCKHGFTGDGYRKCQADENAFHHETRKFCKTIDGKTGECVPYYMCEDRFMSSNQHNDSCGNYFVICCDLGNISEKRLQSN